MHLALRYVLVLLLAPVGAPGKRQGEMCQVWMGGTGSPIGVFQCPRVSDEANAAFCCGTCWLPFCCTLAGARLDQQQCPPDGQLDPMASNHQVGVTPKRPAYPEARMHYAFYIVIALTAVCFFICFYMVFRILKEERSKKRRRMQALQRVQNWLRDVTDADLVEPVRFPLEVACINVPSSYTSPELWFDVDNPLDVQFTLPTSGIPKDKEIILSPATLPTNVLDPTLEPTAEAESVF